MKTTAEKVLSVPTIKIKSDSIKVLVRVRPLSETECTDGDSNLCVDIQSNTSLSLFNSENKRTFHCSFDAILGPSATQSDVYNILKSCTSSVLDGFNTTIFAYGQTGSGKTFSMYGSSIDGTLSTSKNITHQLLNQELVGVIPRAIKDIFHMTIQDTNLQVTIYCSFVQVYNENLYDLLRDSAMKTPLTIREDGKDGIYVPGLSECAVKSVTDAMQLLHTAEENRAVRETAMNLVSSRSHSIFQISVEQRKVAGDGGEVILKAKYNLVDLAGSEKWDLKQRMKDTHIAELTNINLSLHTLGRCISALSMRNKTASSDSTASTTKNHVPYRESKLTRLLQDSLGGNAKTFLLATLSPSRLNIEESINTLKFADRAKQVMVMAVVNESRPVDHVLVKQLQLEILQLKEQMRLLQEHPPLPSTLSNIIGQTGRFATAIETIDVCTNTDSPQMSPIAAMGQKLAHSLTDKFNSLPKELKDYKEPREHFESNISKNTKDESSKGLLPVYQALASSDRERQQEQEREMDLEAERQWTLREKRKIEEEFQLIERERADLEAAKKDRLRQEIEEKRREAERQENEVRQRDRVQQQRERAVFRGAEAVAGAGSKALTMLGNIQRVMGKFFAFEIEEDDMRAQIEQVFVTGKSVKSDLDSSQKQLQQALADSFQAIAAINNKSTESNVSIGNSHSSHPQVQSSYQQSQSGFKTSSLPVVSNSPKRQPYQRSNDIRRLAAQAALNSPSHHHSEGQQSPFSNAGDNMYSSRSEPLLPSRRTQPSKSQTLSQESDAADAVTSLKKNNTKLILDQDSKAAATGHDLSSLPHITCVAKGRNNTISSNNNNSTSSTSSNSKMNSSNFENSDGECRWIGAQEEDEDKLFKQIDLTKKKIQKQQQLQDWVRQKEQRVHVTTKTELEDRKLLQDVVAAREVKRQEYAKKQKQKLEDYQQKIKREAAMIKDLVNLGIDPKSIF